MRGKGKWNKGGISPPILAWCQHLSGCPAAAEASVFAACGSHSVRTTVPAVLGLLGSSL